MEIVVEALQRAGAPVTRFQPRGEGLLARLYSFSQQGDLASLYLAAARNVDPTPVASIDALKAALAKTA
jgi:glucose/mannose-6-phosphate isomerase